MPSGVEKENFLKNYDEFRVLTTYGEFTLLCNSDLLFLVIIVERGVTEEDKLY